MRRKGFIRKAFIYTLVAATVTGNTVPAYAYSNSTFSVDETQDISENTSAECEVYAELGTIFKVTIPKRITLDGSTKKGAYTVDVEGDIAGTDIVKVVPDAGVTLKSTNLADVTGKITQDKTQWSYDEILVGSKVPGKGDIDAAGITAGAWNGTFNFNVNLEHGDNEESENESPLVLSMDDVAMGTADSVQVNAYLDGELANDAVTWSSDNENITVDNGLIETKASAKVGETATVTVTADVEEDVSAIATALSSLGLVDIAYADDKVSATVTVTVVDMEFTSGDETITSIGIKPGESKDVEVTIIPETVTGTVTWSKTAVSGINLVKNGNTVTVKVASDMEVGNTYNLIATYGDFSKTLKINIVSDHIHSYTSSITTEATCTKDGVMTYTCECGDSYTEEIPALGHDYETEYTVDKEATCTEAGSKSQHCSRCDSKQNVTEIPETGHDLASTITKEATCTEEGNMHYECKNCDYAYDEVITATGHIYDVTKYVTDVMPTCTEAGSKSVHCNVCGAKIAGTDIEIPAIGHDYEAFSSGCNASWSNTKNETYAFVQDGDKWTSNNKGINSSTATSTWVMELDEDIEYSFIYKVSSEANYDKLTISLDGTTIADAISGDGSEITYTKTLSAGTHTIVATYLKDSSSSGNDDQAYIILKNINTYVSGHRCSICGDEEEHIYNEGIIITEPSCEETGEKQKTCIICGGTHIETIPATGHDYVNGACAKCNSLEAGLFDADGVMLCTWEESGIDVEKDYSNYGSNYYKDVSTSGYSVLTSKYPTVTQIVIPDGVTSIGDWAFCDCTNLTNIVIPDSVTSIGTDALRNCASLANVEIPEGVTNLGIGAFRECTSLTSIRIPGSVESINTWAFYKCTALSYVDIQSGVKEIGTSAFEYCTNLYNIYLPKSITSIKTSSGVLNAPFYGTNVKEIYMELGFSSSGYEKYWEYWGPGSGQGNAKIYTVTRKEDYLLSKDVDKTQAEVTIPEGIYAIPRGFLSGVSTVESVIISDGVICIDAYAFENCKNLTNVIISNSVTSINNYAFYGCESLTNITIPEDVSTVGAYAFSRCIGLTSVTIPNSVTNIGQAAFYNCSGLTNIEIGNGVTSIEQDAFYNCTNLTSVTYNGVSYTDKQQLISALEENKVYVSNSAFDDTGL